MLNQNLIRTHCAAEPLLLRINHKGKAKCCSPRPNDTHEILRSQPQHSDSIFRHNINSERVMPPYCERGQAKRIHGTSHCSDLGCATFFCVLCLDINLELANFPTTAPREFLVPSKLRFWDILRCWLCTGDPLNKKAEEGVGKDQLILWNKLIEHILCALCYNHQHSTISSWKKMLCGPSKLLSSREGAFEWWT